MGCTEAAWKASRSSVFFGEEGNPSLFTSPALLWESVGEAVRVGGWGELLKAGCSWYLPPEEKHIASPSVLTAPMCSRHC